MKRRVQGAMRSRTMWFSVALVVFGAIFDNFTVLQDTIDPRFYGVLMVFVGVVVALLRFYTTQPLDER